MTVRKKKNRKPAPKVTGVKVKRVATVGTPISGTLTIEVGDRDALVGDLENAFTGERAGLQLVMEVDGAKVTVLAWPRRLVVFDPENVLKSRSSSLYGFQNKVTALLDKWAEAIDRLRFM